MQVVMDINAAMDQLISSRTLEEIDIIMEPLREVLDDALEKIKDKCFEDDAIEEFEDTLQTYLNLSNSMFREVEQNFIVYMDITVRQFVQENENCLCSTLVMVYKAMSVMKMATFFSQESHQSKAVVPRYNIACQQLTSFLFWMIYEQMHHINMVTIVQLFTDLKILAKKNSEVKPAFCFILCTDLSHMCRRFSINALYMPSLLGDLCLQQAKSALNGKALDVAMKHCKHAEENIFGYENSEGFFIWAKALEMKGNIVAAFEKAQWAVTHSRTEEEKKETQAYCDTFRNKMKGRACSPKSNEVDETWLEETNVYRIQREHEIAKAVQEAHIPRKRRSRPKRNRTDSLCSILSNNSQTNGEISTRTSDRSRHVSSNSSESSSIRDPLPQQHPHNGPQFDAEEIDRFLNHQDWESSSDEDDISTDSEPEEPLNLDDSDSDDDLNIKAVYENETSDQTWFEESKDVITNRISSENNPRFCIGSGMNLNENEVAKYCGNRNQNPGRKSFYQDFIPKERLPKLLKTEPQRYKRCRIDIESAQKANCKILDSTGIQTDIEISGRSKCGQSFNNDEVVVEILSNPTKTHKHNISSAKVNSKLYGKVVGVLNSQFHRNSNYPILACTSNETDGWLLRPLCKSVPKIHVVNTVTKKHTPNLVKYRIDTYEVVESRLKYKGRFNINPALRGQYVFIVVYLGWGSKHVYPLGAVVEVLQCGKDFNSGLRILEMQYKVPSLFPEDAVSQIQMIMDKTDRFDPKGREDRTNDLLVFTIDPPQSKDLDDALSIYKQGNNYAVGVHIADVASVVKKDDSIDKEARRRAVSFYVQNRRTHSMLPEPLSHDICSLLPNEIRPTLSIFFLFDQKGEMVAQPIVKKTFIKSCRKFSYEEVQNIIENRLDSSELPELKSNIMDLHNLAQKIRQKRLKDARFSVQFADVRFHDMEDESDCAEAHALVEEFMILTNTHIAKFIKNRFPKCLPLRCQTPPADEDVQNWLSEEKRIVYLLLHLQGKTLSNMVISATEGLRRSTNEKISLIPVQSDIWKSILDCLENRQFSQAQKIICTDEIHPLQNLAWIHWIKLLDTAEYRCSGVTSDNQAKHFSIEIQPYIHFTSPIRRYVDLVSHRLVHAILSGCDCPYTVEDIQQICVDVTDAASRQKAFDRSCKELVKTEKIGKLSMVFHATVDSVTENGLELSLPGLRTVHTKCKEIRFCLLDLCKKPELKKDTTTDKDLVICEWRKRLYDTTGCPSQAVLNMPHNPRTELNIVNPNQHTVLVRFQDWAKILNGIFAQKSSVVKKLVKPLSTSGANDLYSYNKVVDFVTSETGRGTINNHQCKFSLSFKPGQVVKVQLGTSPNNGLLLPQVELVHITKNLSLCHKHLGDPVGILSKYATCSVKRPFHSIEEYKKTWLPVIEMEAALSAASSELTPVINNVAFTLKKESNSGKTVYSGSFQLPTSFCEERNIDFGGKPVELLNDDKTMCHQPCLGCSDYLCIRCFVPGPPENACRDVENGVTWIGHGQIIKAELNEKQKKKRKGAVIENDKVTVSFVLNHSSAPPPQSLMLKSKITGTVEIICKIEVDRRTLHAIQSLKKTDDSEEKGKLARAVVLNGKLPRLSKDRVKMAKSLDKEVMDASSGLPKNNPKQHDAIENALCKSFSLIQGPPGTGKTYTGIKLVYLFNKINARIRTEGGEKCQVLFCGPSNKSVDMVARYLLDRLGDACPKLIRMYGSNIVHQDYPIPNRDLISRRNMHDLKSDPDIRRITLHHVIRDRGTYADDIKMFDNLFALMLKEKKTNDDTSKISRFVRALLQKHSESRGYPTDPDKAGHIIVKLYTKLIGKAYAEELEKCEVILCTCAVGGNEKLAKNKKFKKFKKPESKSSTNIYQCIIDEAAMCPEPLAMVPIIATDAKQVVLIGDHKQLRPIIKCPEAAELGMEQSLFERYSSKCSILTFLDTQYRMHHQICKFPSEQFYDGKLKTGWKPSPRVPKQSDEAESDDKPPIEYPLKIWPNSKIPHVFIHVEGLEEILTVNTEQGNEQSRSNMAEVEKVVQVYQWLIEKEYSLGSKNIVVLSQYNSQVSLLKEKLTEYKNSSRNPEGPRYRNLNVSTVVSSQGGEWDYVIFSTVRSLPSYKIEPNPTLGWCRQNQGFITDANQINVALTRARKGLIIIGNKNLLEVNEVWNNLLQSYKREGCLITDSRNFPRNSRQRQNHQHPRFSEWS